MSNDLIISIAELNENKEFMDALAKAENTEAAIQVFADYGVQISEEELCELVAKKEEGELSAEELEDVAGGKVNWWKVGQGILTIIEALLE